MKHILLSLKVTSKRKTPVYVIVVQSLTVVIAKLFPVAMAVLGILKRS